MKKKEAIGGVEFREPGFRETVKEPFLGRHRPLDCILVEVTSRHGVDFDRVDESVTTLQALRRERLGVHWARPHAACSIRPSAKDNGFR